MPTTAARKHFVPFAVQYFLRQSYLNAELLVLDDSDGAIAALIPEAGNIRYICSPENFSTLGEKRNYACAAASGDIIMHWDDDDWYAPDWVSRQVQVLQQSGAEICGLSELYFYKPQQQLCWRYAYRMDRRAWVAGATLAYRRSLWERNPFVSVTVGEDNRLVWYSGAKVQCSGYTGGFVSLLHAHNTSPKYVNDKQWQPVPLATVAAVMGKDFNRYPRHQEPQ